jgi:hypothetical protein
LKKKGIHNNEQNFSITHSINISFFFHSFYYLFFVIDMILFRFESGVEESHSHFFPKKTTSTPLYQCTSKIDATPFEQFE